MSSQWAPRHRSVLGLRPKKYGESGSTRRLPDLLDRDHLFHTAQGVSPREYMLSNVVLSLKVSMAAQNPS